MQDHFGDFRDESHLGERVVDDDDLIFFICGLELLPGMGVSEGDSECGEDVDCESQVGSS